MDVGGVFLMVGVIFMVVGVWKIAQSHIEAARLLRAVERAKSIWVPKNGRSTAHNKE